MKKHNNSFNYDGRRFDWEYDSEVPHDKTQNLIIEFIQNNPDTLNIDSWVKFLNGKGYKSKKVLKDKLPIKKKTPTKIKRATK